MKSSALQEKLIHIVSNYVADKSKLDSIDAETNFITDLEINSAHLVDVILDIEDAFDIRIENHEMEIMTNVANSLEVIQAKLEK